MARTRSWTDRRDGKLWLLRRGLETDPDSSILVFTHGFEQRIVLTERQTDLDDFTDEELEALLDRSERIHHPSAVDTRAPASIATQIRPAT